jgi:1-pyrroline-5-carboxylate dehydrogenase
MDAVTQVPSPRNEPNQAHAPSSPERTRLEERLKELAADRIELPMTIGGEQRLGGGEPFEVVAPHDHQHALGSGRAATQQDARAAVDAALEAAPGWRALGFDDRAAIFLRAAELLAGQWRATLNAATMLGQSKSVFQAEIDAACELIDFWRFNVHFAREILAQQPLSAPGAWNSLDYRPLEGFVYAVTPFNFTSIA